MRPGIVHRLDKDTSGCMVVAKSQAALMSLQQQIAQRSCSRRYLGLVHGVLPQEQGAWDGPIGRHPVDRRRYAVVGEENGRQARTHQIRVHCSHGGASRCGGSPLQPLPTPSHGLARSDAPCR